MAKRLEYEEIGKFLNGRSIRYIKVDADNYTEYWHFHPEIEITLVERGEGIRIVGDHISAFSDGDLILLGSNLPHCYRINKAENIAVHRSHALQFSLNLFKSLPDLEILHTFLLRANLGYHYKNPSDEIKYYINHFTAFPKHEQFIYFLKIINALYQDSNRTSISNKAFGELHASFRRSNRINTALDYIHKLDGSIAKLEDCAEEMNMSKTYFCRWFKKTTRHTFIEYRNKVMIERFCQELVLSDDSISGIAFKVGFENIHSFNRVFKKIKGVPPKIYKQRYLSALGSL